MKVLWSLHRCSNVLSALWSLSWNRTGHPTDGTNDPFLLLQPELPRTWATMPQVLYLYFLPATVAITCSEGIADRAESKHLKCFPTMHRRSAAVPRTQGGEDRYAAGSRYADIDNLNTDPDVR